MHIAHLAFELGLRGQRGNGVDDHHVDGAGAHDHVRNLERLLAGVGLGDEKLVDVDADLLGVLRVERVLRVDECSGASAALRAGDDLEGEGRLAGGLRPVDLHHPTARQSPHAEGQIQSERPGGDNLDVPDRTRVAHPHDRALAELTLDLREGRVECLSPAVIHAGTPDVLPLPEELGQPAQIIPQPRGAHLANCAVRMWRIGARAP